jgi:hypothetical protein
MTLRRLGRAFVLGVAAAFCQRCVAPIVIGSAIGSLKDRAYVPIANSLIIRRRQQSS